MAATFMIFTVTSNNNLILRYRKLHFGFTRFGKFIVGVIIKKSTKNELELFYLVIIKTKKTIIQIRRLKGSIIYNENLIIVSIGKLLLRGSFQIELFRNCAQCTRHIYEVVVVSKIM